METIEKILKLPNGARMMKRCSYYFLYGFVTVLRPLKILEIGTARGHSAMIMAQALKDHRIDGHIWTIDKNQDYLVQAEANFRTVGLEGYVTIIHGDSALEAGKFGKPLDMVFHDGCHEWEGVKRDFDVVKENTRYIVFHDSCDRWFKGVHRMVNELKASRNWEVVNILEPHMKGLAVCKRM